MGLLLITIIMIVVIEAPGTNYLKVKNRYAPNNSTYLITNVNIIPMNRDTILMNKMVYIEDDTIANL